jgi:phenylacetate-CoA ligase
MKLSSNVEGISWPCVQVDYPATLMALQRQFEQTQWLTPKEILENQFKQLTVLANHATTIPFHAKNLKEAGFVNGKEMTLDIWNRLPILKRSDIRDLKEELHAPSYPKFFGDSIIAYSGGSTGLPVGVKKSQIDSLIWESCHIRELIWNKVDTSKEVTNFRGFAEKSRSNLSKLPNTIMDKSGIVLNSWNPPISLITETGRMGLVQPDLPLPEKVEYILRRKPSYLLMRSGDLRLLLSYLRENNVKIDFIKSAWTISELVDSTLRDICWEVLNCPIYNNYTSNETGYMALQCPEGINYHVMSEAIYLEVIDEHGNNCKQGEIGKVVVTPLHNFAMPLIRYEIGDEAEVGEPCSCGRGLPSLKRIVGRTEEYFTFKNGEKRRVDLDHYKICNIEAIKEFQLIQKTKEKLELHMVVTRPLNQNEMERLDKVRIHSTARDLEWKFVFVDSIKRTAAGKLRQFISEVNI